MHHGELPPVQSPYEPTPEKAGKFAAAKAWVRKNPKMAAVYAVGILALLTLIAAALVATFAPQKLPESLKVTSYKKPDPVYYSPLTGNKVADEAATKQPVTAIMIENSPDARPHSGLKQAGVVYEAIAEGGITRFLAVYQEAKPQLIGPVRSLRMYYLDWATPYDASIAHIGGSKAALDEVRNGKYKDIDQFFNAGSYWRATDRYAPHNVYTSFEKLDALNASKGYTSSTFTAWPRQDGKASEARDASSIAINISSAWYNTQYQYDADNNVYLRSIGGEASNDREEGRIAPNVVIAMKVNMTKVMEDGWRESITTTGSGDVVIFQNGTVVQGKWSKGSRTEQITFTDTDGKEIRLNRGQTWIAAVPNGSGSVTWE